MEIETEVEIDIWCVSHIWVFEFPPFVRAPALPYGGGGSLSAYAWKRELLTATEAHNGITACASSVWGVVVFRECLRISEERRETFVAVWPFLKSFVHVTQRSCVWWQLAQSCSRWELICGKTEFCVNSLAIVRILVRMEITFIVEDHSGNHRRNPTAATVMYI